MKYPIHVSDMKQFLDCRRKWQWTSPLRQYLEPARPYMPFFTGRAAHKALECYYRDGTDVMQTLSSYIFEERKKMGNLWPQEEEQVQEQVELLVGMFQHYMMWVASQATDLPGWLIDENLEFLALETEFQVPILTPSGRTSPKIFLEGRMDGVVHTLVNDQYWVWENKTARSIHELERSLANDPQTGAYMYAATQLFDVPIEGVLYNILRKKTPTEPETLQSGLLTRRANIDTTAQAYSAAIKRHHPDWEVGTIMEFYGDILQKLIDKGNTFFARRAVRRTQVELDNISRKLYVVGMEMTNSNVETYTNETWNCNRCNFRGPCLTWNAGGDYESVLEYEYQLRVPSERSNEEDDEDEAQT